MVLLDLLVLSIWQLDVYKRQDKYQGNIISQVEIPFYIYSARILQSYQGGQGILIRDKNGKEELNSIRFTTPNEEHDILYTMSSGQLSGILLAFSLALHKIFINAGLNIMLIDDPVPVSYTHLDVYKRQLMTLPKPFR